MIDTDIWRQQNLYEFIEKMRDNRIRKEIGITKYKREMRMEERQKSREGLKQHHRAAWRQERERKLGEGQVKEWTNLRQTVSLVDGSLRGTEKRKRRKEGKWRAAGTN